MDLLNKPPMLMNAIRVKILFILLRLIIPKLLKKSLCQAKISVFLLYGGKRTATGLSNYRLLV